MSVFASLKVVNAKRGAGASTDPVMRARQKLVEAIQQQKESVEAFIAGKVYSVTRRSVSGPVERKFRPWWWQQGRTFLTELRYGTSSLHLPGGGTAIEAGAKPEALLKVYDAVVDGINGGELDEELRRVSGLRGRKGTKKGAEGAGTAPQRGKRTARPG